MSLKRILANDGIDSQGKEMLEKAGFFVETQNADESQLVNTITQGKFDVLLVRSATKVTSSVIEACPNLKLIGRAGVGLDNIDLITAKSKGVKVINTPAASSQSVAELVLAHLFSGVRFLQDSNHRMRTEGDSQFGSLKKKYSAGIELRGKTLGIIGFGRIGQALGRMAAGMGMNVIASDPFITEAVLQVEIPMTQTTVPVKVKTVPLSDILMLSDFISIHVPGKVDGKAIIGEHEISMMKPGIGIVNAARGGVIDEDAILHGIDTGKIAFAGLDVFEGEPKPRPELLRNPRISVSPHIGAATSEAQERIGIEMADQIIEFFSA
ncbi:MAG: D-2-hydroxyacid dehydrogenase [Bacteroidia bacterium]